MCNLIVINISTLYCNFLGYLIYKYIQKQIITLKLLLKIFNNTLCYIYIIFCLFFLYIYITILCLFVFIYIFFYLTDSIYGFFTLS